MSESTSTQEQGDDEINAKEAAFILGITMSTLHRWKADGIFKDEIGPYQFRQGSPVRYRRSEVEALKRKKFSE